jgi:restriction endonuclease Mrr
MGRGGWTLIGITAMVGLFLVATSASTLNAGALLWAAVLALLIGSPLFIHLLFFPGDDSVLRSERAGREEVERVSRQEEVDRQTATVARHALDQARMQYNRLSRVFQSRRNALYARDWRSLRGIPFEEFLKEVFEELGFVVEATKASGDQGVDLVLRRGTVEIAVQAKGYAESVGNDAVQAVHTGMTYYGCHRCAVVTNSTFTRAARELADSVGCRLIDGSGIPDLIHGRLDLMGFDSQIR